MEKSIINLSYTHKGSALYIIPVMLFMSLMITLILLGQTLKQDPDIVVAMIVAPVIVGFARSSVLIILMKSVSFTITDKILIMEKNGVISEIHLEDVAHMQRSGRLILKSGLCVDWNLYLFPFFLNMKHDLNRIYPRLFNKSNGD